MARPAGTPKRKYSGSNGSSKRSRVSTSAPSRYSLVRAINPEKKEKESLFLPNFYNLTTATQTFVAPINQIANGSLLQERIGRKIRHASINVNAYAIAKATMQTPDCGFLCLVLDRQPNGAVPAFGDIFDITALPNNSGLAPRTTLTYQERFKVLWRKDWTCNAWSNAQAWTCHDFVDLSKMSGPDATTNYGGTTTSMGDINSGAIYMIGAQSSYFQSVSGAIDFRCHVKYRFTDM